jgi:hypothetical protein
LLGIAHPTGLKTIYLFLLASQKGEQIASDS